MLYDYLKTTIRHLTKSKVYSIITISGLAMGLTCVLCILLFITNELSYDQYHRNSGRIYRVIQGGDSEEQSSSLPFPTGPTLLNDFPDLVEDYVRLFNFQASSLSIVYEDQGTPKAYNEPQFFFADSGYFRIFDHRFIQGDPKTALQGPQFVVVTESTAKRYFGTTEAVGRIIKFEGKHDLTITGVVEDVPLNSHFRWDFLASFTTLPAIGFNIPEKNWYWNPVWTYVLLKKGDDKIILQPQLHNFVQKYYHPSIKDETELNLQPIEDIYLYSRSEYEIGVMSDIQYVKLFATIGLLIILVAVINFINLSTARATDRFKEIGIRKVTGATRLKLISQFLTESILISMIALVLAISFTLLCLPFINQLSDKHFSYTDLFQLRTIAIIILITFASGLLSGLYPAFYLSSLNPSLILKSHVTGRTGRFNFRKVLTVIQFGVSTVLIIGTIVIYQQIQYMKEASLGFNQDQVVVLPVQRLSLVPNYETFKGQLLTNSSIVSISTSNTLLGKDYQSSNYKIEGEEDMTLYPCLFVRNDFVSTMSVPLLAGRDFIQEVSAPGYYAIINRALCKKWGWDPQDAVGKKIEGTLEGSINVVGVVENFHYASLKEEIGPMILLQADFAKSRDFFTRFVFIRLKANHVREGLATIEKTWKQFVTESPFDFFFLDEKLNTLYKQEERVNKVVTTFSFFAIFIGCLGLYGVAIFSFRKRKKEVAIRKVLGASEHSITGLFTIDFLKLVVGGFILGSPLAYYLVQRWLEGYTFRISISPAVFAVSLITLLAISFFTIVFQTVKAALNNPATVLRNE